METFFTRPFALEPNGDSPEVDGYNLIDGDENYLGLIFDEAMAKELLRLLNSTAQ